jgi:cysteine synthase A
MTVLANILQTIGNTPMVELSRITRGLEGRIFAKLEYFNPGFSKKDRIAMQIIEDAEKDGRLKPGQPVVELTSGSTGIGLSIVCAIKGYPFIAVMSKGNSVERAIMMRAFGAEVVLVEQVQGAVPGQVSGEDLILVEQEAQHLVKEKGAFRVDQFHNPSNRRAHELHTAKEIWTQSAGQVEVFVDFAGTGGTFAGCATALRQYNPAIRCYLIEPSGAPFLAGKPVTAPHHKLQGGGYAMPVPLVDRELIEDFIFINDDAAMETTRRLAKEEGIFAGFSSGANVAAALQLLETREKGKNIAVIIEDIGLKYMSNDLFV